MVAELPPLCPHPLCRRPSRQPAAIVARCLHCAMIGSYVDTRTAQVVRLGHAQGQTHEDWMAACRADAVGGHAPWTFGRWLEGGGWDGYRASDYTDTPEEAA